MTGTIGGATYILQFNNQQVVQGMAQTQAQIAQYQTQIVAALNQIVASLNQVTNAAAQTAGQNTQGGGGILGAAVSFVTFSAEIRLAHMAIDALFDSLNFLKDGMIGFNDQLAKAHITWEVFTGDAGAADAKVKELFEFSRKTPFTFQDVDKAARELSAFGGAAFASIENLTLLGNVAAGTQRPLQTITYEFGQMYQEIENGQPFGRAARALVQFGALTAESRTKLEEMQKAGADTSEMLKIFTDDLARFNGLIDKQATQTLEGSMTTLKDTIQSLIAISTKPFFDEILTGINGINKAVEGNSAIMVANTFKKLFQDIIDIFIIFINAFKIDVESFLGLFKVLELGVVEGVAKVLDALAKLPGGAGDHFKQAATNLHAYADSLRTSITAISGDINKAGEDLIAAWTRANDPNWRASGEAAASGWQAGFKGKAKESDDDLEVAAQEYVRSISSAMAGMTPQQLGVANTATDFIKTILLGTSKNDPENIMSEIRPMILRAIKGLNDDVNEGLAELKAVLPPEAFKQISDYFEALHNVDSATRGVAVATLALASAQQTYDDTLAAGKQARADAAQALTDAQDQMTKDMAFYENAIKDLNEALATLRQEATDAAQEQARYVAQAQRELKDLQEQIKKQEQEDRDRIEEAQKLVDERQRIMTEHEEAFQAILDGETERFLRQHDAIDATTQAIIDRYNAEVEGKIRAQAGDDERVTRLQREERAKLLELDTRIRQERAAGHFSEAEALEKQRARVAAYYDDQIKYASQVAAVAKDKADEAKDRVAKAAEAQGDVDKKGVDEATKALNDIKDQAEARRKANQEALDQAQKRVDAAQEEAKRVADDYKDREQAIQQNIISIKAQQEVARIRDQAAIDNAKKIKEETDKTWDKAEADAKATLEHAKDTLTEAKNIKTNADNSLSSLQAITKEWGDQYKYALGILNAARALRDLPPVDFIPGPGKQQPETDPKNRGSGTPDPNPYIPPTPPPPPPPPPRPPAESVPTIPNPSVSPSAAPSRSNPHFITPDAPGFVPTDERPYPDGTWWDVKNGFIPDGYELRDGDYLYWIGVPSSAGAPPAPDFGGGSGGSRDYSMAAMLMSQTPQPISRPSTPAGLYGVASTSADGGSTAGGYGIRELHVPLTFPNMIVDSPQRAAEISNLTVAGVRQALRDAHDRGVGSRVGRKLNS